MSLSGKGRAGMMQSQSAFSGPAIRKKEAIVVRKMEEERKKQKGSIKFTKAKKVIAGSCAVSYMLLAAMPMAVFATSGTDVVTQPLENLKTLVIAVIGAVGVIILAKNVMEFAQAYQQQDSSTMNSALKGIVAGIMMAGISTVLSFLGF